MSAFQPEANAVTALKWNKASDYCLESHDGKYCVTKYLQAGAPLYQAIKKPSESLLVAGTAKLCQQACQSDITNHKGE